MIRAKHNNNTVLVNISKEGFDLKLKPLGYIFIEEVTDVDIANTEESITNNLTAAIQKYMDNVAKEKSYDGILSACTYATSTNPTFAAEGQACVAWRDAVWAYCYQVMADVQAGARAIPTKEELIAELPTKPW